MPDFSEDDELSPSGCRFEELLKGLHSQYSIGHGAEADLDSRIVGQCLMRIDMQRVKSRPELTTFVSEGRR